MRVHSDPDDHLTIFHNFKQRLSLSFQYIMNPWLLFIHIMLTNELHSLKLWTNDYSFLVFHALLIYSYYKPMITIYSQCELMLINYCTNRWFLFTDIMNQWLLSTHVCLTDGYYLLIYNYYEPMITWMDTYYLSFPNPFNLETPKVIPTIIAGIPTVDKYKQLH